MSGGWAGSTRRTELPPNWYTELRPLILHRDEHRCRWRESGTVCGRWANQCDHIGDRDDHRPENLQALCEQHHAIKSSREGSEARWRETTRRKPERHPGLI